MFEIITSDVNPDAEIQFDDGVTLKLSMDLEKPTVRRFEKGEQVPCINFDNPCRAGFDVALSVGIERGQTSHYNSYHVKLRQALLYHVHMSPNFKHAIIFLSGKPGVKEELATTAYKCAHQGARPFKYTFVCAGDMGRLVYVRCE